MEYHPTTIKDIAKVAGLSPSTVSRALNDHKRISQKTKAKILELAKAMDYTPNLFGRGLAKKKTFLIGLLAPDFQNPYYAELTNSIRDTAQEASYWVLQVSTSNITDTTYSIIQSMIKMGVEGIIFASCKLHDPLVENLIDSNFPVVLANRRLKKDKGDYVIPDHTYGVYLVVNHFIRLGYQRIGMIRGPRNASTAQNQYLGYIEAIKEKSLEIDEDIIGEGLYTQDTGYKFTKKLMRLSNPPQAIFCGDDYVALGAMKALHELGLSVPHDVALAGFDDTEISAHPHIQLTTVRCNTSEMGKIAVKFLIEKIEKSSKSFRRILLEPNLVIRQSCGYQLNSNNLGSKSIVINRR